jgi:hypothetical protein
MDAIRPVVEDFVAGKLHKISDDQICVGRQESGKIIPAFPASACPMHL